MIRTLRYYQRNVVGKMPLEDYLILSIGCRASRQAMREALRSALWYADKTGITATLNADQARRHQRPSQPT